jgi:hypothetical protein
LTMSGNLLCGAHPRAPSAGILDPRSRGVNIRDMNNNCHSKRMHAAGSSMHYRRAVTFQRPSPGGAPGLVPALPSSGILPPDHQRRPWGTQWEVRRVQGEPLSPALLSAREKGEEPLRSPETGEGWW